MQFPPSSKRLLSIVADGKFHSGADLALALEISRTSVWNRMNELKELGLEFNAISGKGYCLSRPFEMLDEKLIRVDLTQAAESHLAEIEIHDKLDSTNSRMLGLSSNASTPSGIACLAEYQTRGRGRIGRVWHSPFGGNICLSLLWHFKELNSVSGLSLAVGVSIVRALQSAGVNDVGLKWPNDIVWRGNKLGGILLEVSGEAHGRYTVVIGIGLNVHIPSYRDMAIDQAWVDLDRVTAGHPPSRNRLIALLLNELFLLLPDYAARGLQSYIEEWRQWHCQNGHRAVLHLGGKEIIGVISGVSDNGLLVMECEEGGFRKFASGDLRLRSDDPKSGI